MNSLDSPISPISPKYTIEQVYLNYNSMEHIRSYEKICYPENRIKIIKIDPWYIKIFKKCFIIDN